MNYQTVVNRLKLTYTQFEVLEEMCFRSKNLKNAVLYELRQTFFKGEKIKSKIEYQNTFKNNVDYKKCHSQTGQGAIFQAHQEFSSFLGGLKAFKEKRMEDAPSMPRYLDKENGRNKLVLQKQCFSIKNGKVKIALPKDLKEKYGEAILTLPLPPFINKDNIVMFEILPTTSGFYNLACVYRVGAKVDKKKFGKVNKQTKELIAGPVEEKISENVLSIDLGVSNLLTMADSKTKEAVIISGSVIKMINHFYNKQLANLKSLLPHFINGKGDKIQKKTSSQIQNISYRRKRQLKDYFHKVAKRIIDKCIREGIDTIVIGYNEEWKQNINIGRVNNQNFTFVPHKQLIEYIEYKAKNANITVVKQEEAHTSKCDALAFEEIKHQESYLGKRIKRGLFLSSTGKVINADVNGALNVLRKYFKSIGLESKGESLVREIVSKGRVFRPQKLMISSTCY